MEFKSKQEPAQKGRNSLSCVLVPPMCALVRMGRIWVSPSVRAHPAKIPLFSIIQVKKCWICVFWRWLSDKSNLALPWLPGIYSLTCEICIYENGFPSIWGFSSLSTRNLITHSTGIRCPQHSFSNGCVLLPLPVQ